MKTFYLQIFLVFGALHSAWSQNNTLVFQSDFGLKDGAVAAMKGVAYSVSPELKMFDLTHEIPAFNIWEAAYRLEQTAAYWPEGTVFVSIVDPGVGSERRSVVAKSKSGHFFVTPDNGTLTLIAESLGIEEVREIDETKNRLRNSADSYTFHGRDVYAFTAARLAAGVIRFSEVGPVAKKPVVALSYQKALLDGSKIKGNIDILDVQYGNVWTNISQSLLLKSGVKYGDTLKVKISHESKIYFEGPIKFGTTFSEVKEGENIAYLNSLLNFSLGINMGDFAKHFGIGSGAGWSIEVTK